MNSSVVKLAVTDDICLVTIGKINNNYKELADIFKCLNEKKINYKLVSQAPMIKLKKLDIMLDISLCDFCVFLKQLGKIKKLYEYLFVEIISESTRFSFISDNTNLLPNVIQCLGENNISIRAFNLYDNKLDIYAAESSSDRIIEILSNQFKIELI